MNRFTLLLALISVFSVSLISASAFASETITTIYEPTDDSYSSYPFDDTSVCGSAGNYSIVHGAETSLFPLCNGGSISSWHSMLKYNLSTALNNVIVAGKLRVYRVVAVQCANHELSFFGSSNNTWSEADAVQSLSSDGSILPSFSTGSSTGYYSQNLSINDPISMNVLYGLSSSDFRSFQSINDNSPCANPADKIHLSSKEGSFPPQWNLSYTNSLFGESFFTFGLFGGTAYFDFESQNGSFSNFNQADFSYSNSTNTIMGLHGVLVAPLISEYTTDNTLSLATCSQLNNYGSSYSSVNFPIGNYQTICFKLASQHAGKDFYGAIKVLNNSYSFFDFYWAIYAPSYTTLGIPIVSPAQPRGHQDITISWESSQPTTSGLRWYYISGTTTSSLATIENSTSLTNMHSLVISGSQVPQLSDIYYYVYGNTADNVTYATPYYNFSVGNDVGTPSIDSKYVNNSNYSGAFVLIPVDTDGYPSGLSLDCSITTPFGFTRGYKASDERYYVENLGVTASAWISYSLTNLSLGRYYNVSCISLSDLFVNETHASVLIDAIPKIYHLVIGSSQICRSVLFGVNQKTCEDNMANNFNSTAWYCQYQPNKCNLYDSDGVTCLSFGGYVGYSCDSCSSIPSGYSCNATVGIGQQVNGTTDTSNQICTITGNIFKINCASALGFWACMIFMILGLGLGTYIKNGTVVIMGLLSGMLSFWFAGWIPIWIPIVLGIVAGFLISRWVVNSINPQGSGG